MSERNSHLSGEVLAELAGRSRTRAEIDDEIDSQLRSAVELMPLAVLVIEEAIEELRQLQRGISDVPAPSVGDLCNDEEFLQLLSRVNEAATATCGDLITSDEEVGSRQWLQKAITASRLRLAAFRGGVERLYQDLERLGEIVGMLGLYATSDSLEGWSRRLDRAISNLRHREAA